MVPWPIALLSLFYGAVAAASAATLWKSVSHGHASSVIWSLMWLILSAGSMCGVPLLRPWGWTMAIWTSGLLAVATLGLAGLLVANGHPAGGLAVSLSAGAQVLAIRYLQRPVVKACFKQGQIGLADSRQQTADSTQ